jgi:hypothetical protein
MTNHSEIPNPDDWSQFVDEMNESFLSAFERNVEAQANFVDSWLDTLDESATMDSETMSEGLEGYARAYETWMDAVETQFERSADAMAGEDVDMEEFRDVWLNAANESFKEVMSTAAFAAMTGETVENALEFRQEVDEAAEETLHGLGFATREDVVEVGERLVELERRQHSIETKLDEILEAVE